MKKVFENANQYIAESNWMTFAILKFCLLALGTIIGLCLPKKHRKCALAVCIPVFAATYVPLMAKYVRIACGKSE